MNIFDFKSYKTFLKAYCESERGALTRLAEAADTQKSYISTCLKGKGQLSLDQAFAIAVYLGFSENEQDYFYLLIEKEKAVTPALRRRLEAKAKEMSREAFRIKNQQKDSVVITEGDSGIGFYYATWLATGIHTLTSVPQFQSLANLGKRLNLNQESIAMIVEYLVKMELIKKSGEKFQWNSSNMHLEDNSMWISGHHTNWRARAIDNIQKRDKEATHYSAIQSFSEEDFDKLKKKIVHFINDFNKVADPSEPEDAFCFNIDLFRI
ncbi:TIGR02147 family protein [Bdellovibrio sp. HCB274]|uniref:TIGR02147 family protein n=1 Tax=Bdellovibrio sp. HCB274 TaxID=3394361 RepID=UPI0039B6AC13